METLLIYFIPMAVILTLVYIFRKEMNYKDKEIAVLIACVPVANFFAAILFTIMTIRDQLEKD